MKSVKKVVLDIPTHIQRKVSADMRRLVTINIELKVLGPCTQLSQQQIDIFNNLPKK